MMINQIRYQMKAKDEQSLDKLIQMFQSSGGGSFIRKHPGCKSVELLVDRANLTATVEEGWQSFEDHIDHYNNRVDPAWLNEVESLCIDRPTRYEMELVETGGRRKAA